MELQTIHCFLVYPAKHEEEPPDIKGTTVPKSGRLYEMLKSIFDNAEGECNIEISFNQNDEGEQQNDCRDLLLAYLENHSVADGRNIALQLQKVTTRKSGLGLFFVMAGKADGKNKIVLSRFPADQGIMAEENKEKLTVEFLEKVFMKSATAYKSALYVGKSVHADFWTGHAVDKQMNYGGEVANYWIGEFLQSDLRTTGASGSRRLAVALREAVQSVDDFDAKSEITAAVTLAGSVDKKTLSADEFCAHFGLSGGALTAVRSALKHEELAADKFRFDLEEFKKHIAFRSVELNNGAVLTAQAAAFDDVFEKEVLKESEVRYTTKGKIVAERLRKGKA